MPPTVTSVKIPSTPMVKGVQSTITLADQAVAAGQAAVAASKKALAKSKKARDRKGIRAATSAVTKNKKTLALAQKLRADLKASDKLAHSLCPLNVLFFDFRYVQPGK